MEIGHASPMDTGNPALGAASGAAEAASSAGYSAAQNYAAGLRFAEALRSAAQQQSQQQHQDRLRAFDEEMRIRQAGGTPYLEEQAPVNTGVVPGKGLIPRDKSAAAQKAPQQNVISDSFGRRWVLPDKAATTQDNKSFTESREAAAGGALPVSGGQVRNPNDNTPRFSADESGNLTSQGFGLNVPVSDLSGTMLKTAGGQQFYQPTPDEKANIGLRGDLAKKAAETSAKPRVHVDSEHFNVPSMVNEETGDVTPLKLAPGVKHNDKAEKPDKYTYNHFTDDSGKVSVSRIGPGGKPEIWDGKAQDWSPMGADSRIGPKRRDPDAPPREKPPSPAQFIAVSRTKESALRTAETEFTRALSASRKEYLKAVQEDNSPDGQAAALKGVADRRKEAEDDLAKAKQAAQDAFEEQVGTLTGKSVEHVSVNASGKASAAPPQSASVNQAPQQQPAKPTAPPANPQQSAKAATPQKTANNQPRGPLNDENIARSYLTKAKGNKDAARKLAKADGWEF